MTTAHDASSAAITGGGALPRRPHALAGALLLAALVVAAYLPVLRAGFIWDDDKHVTKNPVLLRDDGLALAWRLPLTDPQALATPQYYPLTHTTFWLEHQLWAMEPLGYHLDNVLLHAASAIALWLVLMRLGLPWAWLAAALWALLPVQVESVAWVTERKNVLSLFLELAALHAYLAFEPALTGPPARRRWDLYLLALLLFVLAMLAKTVACTLPLVILILIWWKQARLRWRDILPLLPMMAIGAAMGLLTGYLERARVGAAGPDWDFSPAQRILIAGRAIWFQFGKLLWPADLMFSYPRWHIDPAAAWQWLWPVAVLIVITALWLARRRIGRGPTAAAKIFVVVLLPSLGFVNVYPMRYTFVADHYQYAASAALVALAVATAARARRGRDALLAVGILLLPVLAALTLTRARIFRSAESLWWDTVAKNPTSWMARDNLAVILVNGGGAAPTPAPDGSEALPGNDAQTLQRGRLLEATALYAEVARLRPLHEKLYINWGDALLKLDRYDDTARMYQRRLDIAQEPGGPPLSDDARAGVLQDMAAAFQAGSQPDRALQCLRQAVAAAPRNLAVHLELAKQLQRMNRPAQAVAEVHAAANAPDSDAAHWPDAASFLWDLGDRAGARALFDRYLERFPPLDQDSRLRTAQFYLRNGQLDNAAGWFRAALQIDPHSAEALGGLAAIDLARAAPTTAK